MRDFEIKFRHILHNRDIGLENLAQDSSRVLMKILQEHGAIDYRIPNVCDAIGRKDDKLWIILGDAITPYDGPECPMTNLQKAEFYVRKVRPKAQATLSNIINAYEKAMGNLVKNAMKEFPRYFQPGKVVSADLGPYGSAFGCSGEDQYYVINGSSRIPWNGKHSPFSDRQRMEIYNILKEVIY